MTNFNRLLKAMLNPWVSVSYVCFVVLSFAYFDKPIAYYFHHLDLKANLPVLKLITFVGTGVVCIGLLLICALIFRYVYKNKTREMRSWVLLLCVLIPNIISLALKILLGRARPELLFDQSLYGFYGLHFVRPFWSFPSGHTTTVVGLVLGLMLIFPRHFYAFIVAGLLVISTRVFLTDHYLSDVLGTSYLVLFEVGLLSIIFRDKKWIA